jgi:hypothetical protein
MALAATLWVSADARRLDAGLGAPHPQGAETGFRVSGVFYEGPAYDGCCDEVDGAVLDCCITGGCCPEDDGVFLDCCIHAAGDNDGNVRTSRVIYEGPAYDGCCQGEPLMGCCARGGCCPDDDGVSLSCCSGGDVGRARGIALPGGFFAPALGDERGVVDDGETRALKSRPSVGKKRSSEEDGSTEDGSTEDVSTEDVASSSSGASVVHEVPPEIAFLPAEEADASDPTYGRFAKLDPGGAGYYERDSRDDGAVSKDDAPLLIAVADAANDDSVDPTDPSAVHPIGLSETAHETVSGKPDGGKKLHTKRWWERYAAGKKKDALGVSWRAFILQGASAACAVVWLTALVVSAVLKRADGRDLGSEEERTGLL